MCWMQIAVLAAVLPPGMFHAQDRAHSGIPSVAVSPKNGRMWATWYASPTPGEDKNSYVILSTSADGGATWREVLVSDPDGKGPWRAFDPEVWIAPDGRLRWTWTERKCKPDEVDVSRRYAGDEGDPKTDRLMMAELSADDAAVTVPSVRQIGRGVMMCKPTFLDDGSWLLPVAWWQEAPSGRFYRTADGGKSFMLEPAGITLPKDVRLYDEHQAVELKDGSLLCFLRSHGRSHPWEAVSTDCGRSWSAARLARFDNCSARVFVRRLKSGNILLVKNGDVGEKTAKRERLTAFLSEDEGRTWKGGLVLDARDSVAYPDGDQRADGTLVVTYDYDRFGEQAILFAEFAEEDVLAGKDVSGKTRLQRIISRRANESKKSIELFPDEHWYGAETVLGSVEPFSATNLYKKVDLRYDHGSGIGGNQAAPVLLSSKGRWVWCERPFVFQFADGRLTVEADRADAKVETGKAGETLRSAYLHCSGTYFPPQGTPKLEWFKNPIVNTWASLGYMQKQADILELARGFKGMGVPPGVFMIDHGWHEKPMGTWDFDRSFIPDPKGMVREMKEKLGYSAVILWFDNHVAMESLHYRDIVRKGYTLKSDAKGYQLSFISQWWAGWGAVLDCTNPECFNATKAHLRWLMETYGVDGFFFDAGDPGNFVNLLGFDRNVPRPHDKTAAPSDMVRAYHMLGTTVPYQQHRACWKMGGLPLKQTERDKAPTFEALRMCLSNGIVAGLIGYPFIDFDMVGGGLYGPTQKDCVVINQDQFVRSMQVQCLSPMVQLSIPPWKVLDAAHLSAFKKAIELRRKWTPYVVETAVSTGKTGEPMMRSLEYAYPGHGYETVMDEFLMGEKLLVAPQVTEGARTRKVVIPPGMWTADDGQVFEGPTVVDVETPIDRLPHFIR